MLYSSAQKIVPKSSSHIQRYESQTIKFHKHTCDNVPLYMHFMLSCNIFYIAEKLGGVFKKNC